MTKKSWLKLQKKKKRLIKQNQDQEDEDKKQGACHFHRRQGNRQRKGRKEAKMKKRHCWTKGATHTTRKKDDFFEMQGSREKIPAFFEIQGCFRKVLGGDWKYFWMIFWDHFGTYFERYWRGF